MQYKHADVGTAAILLKQPFSRFWFPTQKESAALIISQFKVAENSDLLPKANKHARKIQN